MNELLTIIGCLLVVIGFSCLYVAAGVCLFKLCCRCFNDGNYVLAVAFTSFLMMMIGAAFGIIGSVI